MLAGIPVCSFDGDLRTLDARGETMVVVVELPTGQSIRLLEGPIQIISFDPPREHVLIKAHPEDAIEFRGTVDPRIEFVGTRDGVWRYDLYGTIVKTDAKDVHGDSDFTYVLDVGVGTMLVDPELSALCPPEESPPEVGDEVHIPAARLELHDDMQLNV